MVLTWAIAVAILLITLITLTASKRNISRAFVPGSGPAGLGSLSDKRLVLARPLALMLLLVVIAVGLASCGGSTSGGGGGGGLVTFPLTIQARSNSATTNLQTISITVP
jgi:hypothetical protein